MNNKTIRIRRLGSVTFGIVMIALGIIMIINAIFAEFDLVLLLRFWPVILVFLGIEVLLGNHYKSTEIINPEGKAIEQNKVIYDIPAVIMMSITLFMVYIIALAEWLYKNETAWFYDLM